MPVTGSDPSIYRAVKPVEFPTMGGDTSAPGQRGPNVGMARLGLEQQKAQDISAIFQQYGQDYDTAAQVVAQKYPEDGQKLIALIANGREQGARQHIAETESSLKNLEMVGHGIELAIQDPTQYPKLLNDIAKQPGGSRYLQFAPDPSDPELVPKLKAILPAVLGPKEFLSQTKQAAQDYLDGDKQLGAARSLAAADTPEKRQIVEKWLADGGLKDYAQLWPDAATAAQARDLMLEQQKKEKPDSETNWQLKESMVNGKRVFMWANPKTLESKPAEGMGSPIPPASLIVQNQNAGAVAASIPGQTRTTLSGKQYIDLGDFGTPKEQAAARAAAMKAGIMAVDKQTGASLRAVDTAKQNAMSIWSSIKDKLPKDAQGRLAGSPKNKLSAYFQTDADLAAFGSWRTAAIQQVQALAEPGMGLRINQAEIKQAMENDIPKITDDVGTAAQRIKNLLTMLNHKENDALTRNRSSLLTESSTAPNKVNPFLKK